MLNNLKLALAGFGFFLALVSSARADETECRDVEIYTTLCVAPADLSQADECETEIHSITICRHGWERFTHVEIVANPLDAVMADNEDPIFGIDALTGEVKW